MATDCLILGYYDSPFPDYVEMLRGMGEKSGAFRDLNLAYIDYQGQPYRCMDLLNKLHFKEQSPIRPFHNCDFLWPTISYLGTYLHQRGFNFDYVNLPHLEHQQLRQKLQQQQVLTVAITTTLYVAPHPIQELVSLIRKYNDQAKIIVGGPYIYNQRQMLDSRQLQELLAFLAADIYVINQAGEQALIEVLNALKNHTPLSAIANIAYRPNSNITHSTQTREKLRQWLRDNPEQARQLLQKRHQQSAQTVTDNEFLFTANASEDNALADNRVDYHLFPRTDLGGFVSLWTAQSCPFACAFCGFPQRAGKYVYLPVALIEQELMQLHELGVHTLTFIDDTLNVPKKRFKDMLRMMIRNDFGFSWNCFYRGDHGDAETIELMAAAGCEGVFIGVESGSDVMLKHMNKTARRADYETAIPLLRQAGILTHTNFIIGFPGETDATVKESIDFIEKTAPDTYRAQLWYCDPLTPIWHQREQYGVQGSAFNWSHATMHHQHAADWVDELFVCIENSTWLPQHSFEQWSILYLQRQGMSREQVMRFIRAFNGLIKQKLRFGTEQNPDQSLLAKMNDACAFETG